METTATATKDVTIPTERSRRIAEKHKANGYSYPSFEQLIEATVGVRSAVDAVGSVGTLIIMAEFFDVLAETSKSESFKQTTSILQDAAEKLVEMMSTRSAERFPQN